MNQITNFSSLFLMFLPWERRSVIFSISIIYTKGGSSPLPLITNPSTMSLASICLIMLWCTWLSLLCQTPRLWLFSFLLKTPTTLTNNALWLLQYDGGFMVTRSRHMPHSSTPFTTTLLPSNNRHLLLVWEVYIPFWTPQDVEFFFTKLGNMNDIL